MTAQPKWNLIRTLLEHGPIVAIKTIHGQTYLVTCDGRTLRVWEEGTQPVVRSMYSLERERNCPVVGTSNALGGELKLRDYAEFGNDAIDWHIDLVEEAQS